MAYSVWQQFIQNDLGDVLSSASIEVRDESTGALAVLYSTSTGVSLANPFTASIDGLARFYAAAGVYKIVATSGTDTATYRHVQLGTSQSVDVGTSTGQLPLAEAVIYTSVTESTTSRTLTASDNKKHIRCTSGSATTITLPAGLTDLKECRIFRDGSGTVTLSHPSTVTVNAKALAISPQNGCAMLFRVGTNEYDYFGDLA